MKDYLNLNQKQDLYTALMGIEALNRMGHWEWLTGKTGGALKAFHTRFDRCLWPDILEKLPAETTRNMESVTKGYAIQFTPRFKSFEDKHTVRIDDIADLLEMLIKDHCEGCTLAPDKVKDCPIRRVEANLMNGKTGKNPAECEYKY